MYIHIEARTGVIWIERHRYVIVDIDIWVCTSKPILGTFLKPKPRRKNAYIQKLEPKNLHPPISHTFNL